MARQLVWSLSSQSPLDEAVVARCAQQKAASATPLERGIENWTTLAGHAHSRIAQVPFEEGSEQAWKEY